MSKQFDIRVRETIIRLYTVEAEDEADARQAFANGETLGNPLEVDSVDNEIESVKESR